MKNSLENNEKYRALCSQETSIPLFSQAWWLDATAGADNWDVSLVEKSGEIVAALPYAIRMLYGFKILTQPKLTQTSGPWLRESKKKSSSKLAQQKEWMGELIDRLPAFDLYSQHWSWNNQNWLPFYWRNFNQTTRYTYILNNLASENDLWKGFEENTRWEIRKAKSRFSLNVRTDLTIDDFLPLNEMTFRRQGMVLPYSWDFVRKLDRACMERGSRAIFIAEDQEGRRHAGVYIVWDKNSAYYLMGGGDPELRNSGATSLCMWEAIKFASTVTQRFDFEGSMIESVEKFFRGFGATQAPYFSVKKVPSILLKFALFARDLKNR